VGSGGYAGAGNVQVIDRLRVPGPLPGRSGPSIRLTCPLRKDRLLRRTKIVATLGPATRSPEALRELLAAGVDVVRINFAHGTVDDHRQAAKLVRFIAKELGREVGILVDLPGPKMRTGPVVDDDNGVRLVTGQEYVLVDSEVIGDDARVSHTVHDLASMCHVGDEVFLANGEIVLRVTEIRGPDVATLVERGGVLKSRKGMHVPSAEHKVEAFTPEDAEALQVALAIKADFVGLSFVRDGDDLRRARAALPKRAPRPHLVAKIETRSALDALDDIIAEADVVMVARGDLGIQVELHRLPMLQKEIIAACNRAGKPVITATEMLESMCWSPLPSRAEVADVANAVYDGTDALMLSEETAVGEFPSESVRTMAAIAGAADSAELNHIVPVHNELRYDRVSWAVAHAAALAAEDLGVAAVLCPTRTGATARRIAAFRPSMPVIGFSPRSDTIGHLSVVWGVQSLLMNEAKDRPEEVEAVVIAARDRGWVAPEDLVAIVAGSPGPRAGGTDYVRIVRVWPASEDWSRSHT
jgi:pyruvate kinase